MDLINRQDVLDYIDNMPSELTSDGRRMIRRSMLTAYITDTLPSVQCDDCPYRYHWLTQAMNSNRGNGGATA